jgi:glycosyltransferase involved in cell wall biosynthesis
MIMMLCVFIHRYRWGVQIRGDERGFYEKAKIYKRKKIKLFVIERKPSIAGSLDPEVYESIYMNKVYLPLRNIFDLAQVLFEALVPLLKLRKRPNVVYVYNQDPENVIVGYVAKLLYRVPMVIVYHHISPSTLDTLRAGVARRRLSGYRLHSAVWRSLIPCVNRFCAGKADLHLALSCSTAQEVKRLLGVQYCVVVGNGLDTNTFKNLGLERIYDAIFLGRLVQQKGIDVLLSAWAEVVKHIPQAQLVVVGGGDAPLTRRFKDMAISLGLNGSVRFTGFVNDDELVILLNKAKVFVFPSRREGFAQAVSQAMACGLCCILSDIPSLRELYRDAAVYFPVDDHSVLASMILKYLQNHVLRLQMGECAERSVSKLRWEDVVEKEIFHIFNAMKKGVSK